MEINQTSPPVDAANFILISMSLSNLIYLSVQPKGYNPDLLYISFH